MFSLLLKELIFDFYLSGILFTYETCIDNILFYVNIVYMFYVLYCLHLYV